MLRLEDDWIWDSWIADDGETYHVGGGRGGTPYR